MRWGGVWGVERAGRRAEEAILRPLGQRWLAKHRRLGVARHRLGVDNFHSFQHHIHRHDSYRTVVTGVHRSLKVNTTISWAFCRQKLSEAAMASVQPWRLCGVSWGWCKWMACGCWVVTSTASVLIAYFFLKTQQTHDALHPATDWATVATPPRLDKPRPLSTFAPWPFNTPSCAGGKERSFAAIQWA